MCTGVAPAIDNGAVAALKQGRIKVLPAIRCFHPDAVELVDDRRIAPDVVIAAVGCTTGLEGKLAGLDVLDARCWSAWVAMPKKPGIMKSLSRT
ncbi:hypothetical protein RNZ50_06630 [Paracoccaceae bacterium Fryx2]|nr:hypothetical protein [Paracoccaceae bacterium Fryx2]